MDKWTELCVGINDLQKRANSEAEYEFGLVQIFKYLLKWNNLQEQVETEIGNRQKLRPDIILCDKNKKNQIIIELKRPDSVGEGATQIASYLKIFKVKFGLLIDKSISIFYNELNEEPIKLATLHFIEDEENGKELALVLDAEKFTEKKMEEFCLKLKKKLKIDKDAEKIVELLIGPEGKKILKAGLKNTEELSGFNSLSIDKAIDKIQLNRSKENVAASINIQPATQYNQKTVGIVTDGAIINLIDCEINKIVGVKPTVLFVQDKSYEVSSWQNITEIVLWSAWKKSRECLDNNISISKDTTRLRVAKRIGDSGYYYEGNKSAIDLIKTIREVAQKAGLQNITVKLR